MKLTIRNFRGIESASITLSPIALVAGPNAAGKSSVAMAMAACLRQTPMPIDGVAKNQCSLLLRRDAKRGSATLETANGSATVNWPGGSVSTDGAFPVSSDFAAGVLSVADMSAKESTAALRRYVGAEPTRDDLRAALPTAEISDGIVDNIWQSIQTDGWDAAHRRAKETGTRAKGRWEQITGDNYGSAKAVGWVSPLWPSDESRSPEELQAAVADATARLEGLIGQQALSDDEMQRLRDTASQTVPYTVELHERLSAAEARLHEASQHYAGLPRPVTLKHPLSCPHCGAEVEICAGQVVKFSAEVDHAENVRRAGDIADALSAKNAAEAECHAIRNDLRTAEAVEKQVSDAREKLATCEGRSVSAADIEAARAEVRRLQDVLMGMEATVQAEKVAFSIAVNKIICEAIDVTGVRQTVMTRALAGFNDRLAALSAIADWGVVAVTGDMRVAYDGAPYALLSASEQFRCRVTLQVAMAEIDDSRALVIDAADILDRSGRNGLFKLARASGIPALITMTMNHAEDVPDLAKAGLGQSYWIDEAIAEVL